MISLLVALLTLTSFSNSYAAGVIRIDRQLHLNDENEHIANPPIQTNNQGKDFKVKVAIIDEGVDYNHPYLKDHIIQFEDRIGKDYVGRDSLPSPYFVRTIFDDPHAVFKSQGEQQMERIRSIKVKEPKLSPYFNEWRLINYEMINLAYHGTHVAHLATQGNEDIGILPYRISMAPRALDSYGQGISSVEAYRESLLEAIKQSIKDGAQIINLSLVTGAMKDDIGQWQSLLFFEERLTKVLNDNPNVLLVAAAGNDGEDIDGNENKVLPCQLNHPRVLCVGAVDKENKRWELSNFPLNKKEFVWERGVDIYSAKPIDMCLHPSIPDIVKGRLAPSVDELKEIADYCDQNQLEAKLSGTSMATPTVSHQVAKLLIEDSSLSPEELIKKIIE
ncbi:MAG: S8 family peptidase [Bacteriovoracaceae bacterium]